jgi:hypothetical protein
MKFRFVFALMMEAACTSETSVDNYFTRQYIPEDKSLNCRCVVLVLNYMEETFEMKISGSNGSECVFEVGDTDVSDMRTASIITLMM